VKKSYWLLTLRGYKRLVTLMQCGNVLKPTTITVFVNDVTCKTEFVTDTRQTPDGDMCFRCLQRLWLICTREQVYGVKETLTHLHQRTSLWRIKTQTQLHCMMMVCFLTETLTNKMCREFCCIVSIVSSVITLPRRYIKHICSVLTSCRGEVPTHWINMLRIQPCTLRFSLLN